jgi:hypothetical protein
MALTPEQNAALQLVLERGQSYADLARLLQSDEAAIRARARAALTELGGADPDRHVALTDYLLGQADPIGRADAVRHLRDDPEDRRLAAELIEILREMYPGADLPRLPGEARAPRRRPATKPDPGAAGEGGGGLADRISLGPRQSRVLAIGGAAAILLIAAVLGIAGVFGGDDDPSEPTATTTSSQEPDTEAIPVRMRPVGGSDAGGVVVIGFATADQPFVEFQLRNLQPATNGDAYVLWFLLDDGQGYPLPSELPVDDQGRVADRIAVPAEVISVALQADSIAVALNDRDQLNRDINRALTGGAAMLEYPGGTVLEAELRGARQSAQAGG